MRIDELARTLYSRGELKLHSQGRQRDFETFDDLRVEIRESLSQRQALQPRFQCHTRKKEKQKEARRVFIIRSNEQRSCATQERTAVLIDDRATAHFASAPHHHVTSL